MSARGKSFNAIILAKNRSESHHVTLYSAPRFNSYQQQDSHELLRYLLDALKSEEIQVRPWHACTVFINILISILG